MRIRGPRSAKSLAPRWRALLLFAVLAGTTAFVHALLKRSAPADRARIGAPHELRLTFTEPVELAFTRIQLLDSAGREVALSPVRLVSDTAGQVVADIAGSIPPGLFTVAWQVAGRDGHPVRGRFSFTVLAPPRPSPGPVDSNSPPAQSGHTPAANASQNSGLSAESPGFVVVRIFTYLALVGIIGVAAFHFFVLQRMRRAPQPVKDVLINEAERKAAALGLGAAAAFLFMALVRLLAQSYAVHGGESALDFYLILAMIWQTLWGWGWLLQVSAGVLLVIAFGQARKGTNWGWMLVGIAAIAAAAVPALSGHAASSLVPGLTILGDTLHVLGAGTWLGTLLILTAAGLPAARRVGGEERHAGVAAFVNYFSPLALVGAGITALTGLFAAWMHLGAIPNLWRTPYGLTLLVKLLVLAGVAATGAYNWRFVRPRLGVAGGTRRITRSARLELGIALVVIIITAVLVAQPVPTQP